MKVQERFSDAAVEFLRTEIQEAGGREVLFIAKIDGKTEKIHEVTVGARGTREMVPAIFVHMERGDVVVHNHPSGLLEPSQADLGVAGSLGQNGIGFWIVDNPVTEFYALSEPILLGEQQNLDEDYVAGILSEAGAFSRLLSNYEPRSQQIALSRLFTKGFNASAVVSAEAGTGVGKSFAYLVPAILWAEANKERVVIATATINLQQQIYEKDLPFVQKALGTKLRTVLVKGRRNYLCPSRLEDELRDPLNPDSLETLRRIQEWAQVTKNGDVQELSFFPPDAVWSRVCSDSDVCSGIRCAQQEGCFLAKARKEAAGSSLLVANHHLLFADLSLRLEGFGFETTVVLPPFQRLVLDEAHNLEKSATSYFSSEFSRPFLQKQLHRVYRKRRNLETGLISALRGVFTQNLDLGSVPSLLAQILDGIDAADKQLLEALGTESSLRLTRDKEPWWVEQMMPALIGIQIPLLKLLELSFAVVELWDEQEERPSEVQELKTTARRLEGFSRILDRFKKWVEDSGNVFWFQKLKDWQGKTYLAWTVSPLSIQDVFCEAVFRPFKTVLLTSATLTVQGKFTFWGTRLGLNRVGSERRLFGIFPSPYDYEQRVLLGVPTDFPSPSSPEYQSALEDYLKTLLLASKGSALVLFTSYESLRRAHAHVAPLLAQQGIAIYKQGDDDRQRLLERFKAEVESVLFATDSFWEGVDSPGETLRLLVICKLPFRVPSEPILSARLEAIANLGQDPFLSYSLPEALTRFAQGFGRLIRHTSDYGAVVVLDNRIVQKNYGKSFLDSIPRTKRTFTSSSQVTQEVVDFLEGWKGKL
jgi:ATP-dependent DNA helicase DinG